VKVVGLEKTKLRDRVLASLSLNMVTHFADDYEHAAALKKNGTLDLSKTPECSLCHKEDPKVLSSLKQQAVTTY
jgi:hypothetical protein